MLDNGHASHFNCVSKLFNYGCLSNFGTFCGRSVTFFVSDVSEDPEVRNIREDDAASVPRRQESLTAQYEHRVLIETNALLASIVSTEAAYRLSLTSLVTCYSVSGAHEAHCIANAEL